MKRTLFSIFCAFMVIGCTAPGQKTISGYPITPVAFTSVKVNGGFWGQRLQASRDVTVPLAFSKCEETGRYENFIRAANPDTSYHVGGFPFDDTDVYKTIEGASYLLQTYPDKQMEHYIDSIIKIVALGQEPDGYLNTARTMSPSHPHPWMGPERWKSAESGSHELYNLGHMIEGAVAYYQATGKREFLDIAIRYADCVCENIGKGEGQLRIVPGHEIAEMALVRLYLATGEKKYLDQAHYFVEERGKTARRDRYDQSHLPVLEQDEAVGHAVRAEYFYAGVADVAAVTGESSYIEAIDRIWDNIVSKKLYITGGVGARHGGEAFGDNYELPNESAYCETCAAIGNVYTNFRLFLLHGESKYIDVLERTLYNGLISGVSLDGGAFFYPNPLASHGRHQREPWFGCACCPSNISRFIPSLPGYVYAVKDDQVFVNLYLENSAELNINNKQFTLSQSTSYPWDGDIRLNVEKGSGEFTMRLRIPGWVQGDVVPSDLYSYADGKSLNYSVKVNGEEYKSETVDGYVNINRKWKKGDVVELHLDMEARLVKAHENVVADRGRLAVERGPLVYCAEWPDNDFNIHEVELNAGSAFEAVEKSELLYGIVGLSTPVQAMCPDEAGKLVPQDKSLTLIPYYAWAHRGQGDMAVWLHAAE